MANGIVRVANNSFANGKWTPTPVANDTVDTESKPSGFNNYAAGRKVYGGGRTAPNLGPVLNRLGYSQRDNNAEARKAAILRRMKGQSTGNSFGTYTNGVF